MTKITYNAQHHDIATVANLMDDEIRELLHAARDWTSEQAFFNAYVEAHLEKYGEDFIIN
jgi:hypothetical protein